MLSTNKFWNIKTNSSNPNEVDVFIYGMIGSSGWFKQPDDTIASEFVSEFKNLEKQYDRINIRINSPGGDINEGLPIFNCILQSPKDIHTYNDGIAYSMASIILQAGKTRHAAKNSLTLFHSPSMFEFGNAQDFRESAEFLDTYENSLIQCMVDKTGLTSSQIKAKYFDYKDHLISAQAALDDKIIDVIENTPGKLPDNIENMTYAQIVQAYMKDNPVKNNFMGNLIDHLKSAFNISPKIENDSTMNDLKKIKDLLGLDEKATIEDILAAITNMQNEKKTTEDSVTSVSAEKTQMTTDLATANANLQTVTAERDQVKADFAAFKAEDAERETKAKKDKDKIDSEKDPKDEFAHNQIADDIASQKEPEN
jgi:ATP-dependent Clp protease protease subunit